MSFDPAQEYLWLSRTLRHSTSDWIVVAGHRPVWSGASRDTCAAELPFQLEMNRLLAERGVDVYISAHDHTGAEMDRQKIPFAPPAVCPRCSGITFPLPVTAQLIAGDGDVSYIVNGIGNEDPHAATHIPGRTVYSGTGFIGFAIHQVRTTGPPSLFALMAIVVRDLGVWCLMRRARGNSLHRRP